MRIAIMITVAALSLSPPTASAQSIPRYNPAAHCEVVADTASGSRVIYNGCMQMEQEAYNDLKGSWSELSAKTRSHCDKVARSGGKGTYAILKGCIDMEAEAAADEPEFEF